MKHLFTCTFLVLLFFSCGESIRHAPNEISLDLFATDVKEVNINEIASRIDYVQLETTPESLIGNIDKILTKDNKIYILDIDNAPSLLVFDISGKFIRKIGTKGNGPGEYVEIHDFALHDSVLLAMDCMQRKIILYDTLGRLVAEKHVKKYLHKVAFYNDMIAGQHNYPDFAFNNGFRVSIYDRNINPAANILKSEDTLTEATAMQINATHAMSFFANVNDTLTFWESRDDVVYKIIDENNIVEKYRIQYKSKALFEDGLLKLKEGRNLMTQTMDTENFLFFTGSYQDEYCQLVYSKKNATGTNVGEGFKTSGGPDFFPYGVTEDNKAYHTFSVYAYKTELEEIGISPDTLDPQLQALVNTCDFDNNPCIMLVTLK